MVDPLLGIEASRSPLLKQGGKPTFQGWEMPLSSPQCL